MEKEKLRNLDTSGLKKRRTFAALILGILIGLILVNITAAVLGADPAAGALSLGLGAAGIPVALALRTLSAELRKRDND